MTGAGRESRSDQLSAPCWVLSDGKAGTENQCIGLAEAVGLNFTVKRIVPRRSWRRLPTRLWVSLIGAHPNASLTRSGDTLDPPWPDLLIASGRASVAHAVAIRRASQGRTFAVQIQNPRIPSHYFDLVVPPRHDHVRGPNVISTLGALNRITPQRLEDAAARLAGEIKHLPRPLVAVLIGGSNRAFKMTHSDTTRLLAGLTKLTAAEGAGLRVTTSRRTGRENASRLQAGLRDLPALLWDGSGENPYFGFLAHADAIVVTEDSVSMTSEACTTGKPVYVAPLTGGSRKFREFHDSLVDEGYTLPFVGALADRAPKRLDDTAAIAEEVRRRLAISA